MKQLLNKIKLIVTICLNWKKKIFTVLKSGSNGTKNGLEIQKESTTPKKPLQKEKSAKLVSSETGRSQSKGSTKSQTSTGTTKSTKQGKPKSGSTSRSKAKI